VLLAFDLDGTLVTAEGVLPEPLRRAVLAASVRHHVTVLTGRNYRSARRFIEAIAPNVPYGTCQGARLHALDATLLEEFHLENEAVEFLLERFLPDSHTEIFLSTADGVYVRQPARDRWDRARGEGQVVKDIEHYTGEAAHKALLFSDVLDKVTELRLEVQARFPQLNYYGWGGWYLEVVSSGGRKSRALASIASRLGVPQSEVVAFGDGENDISMLEWAGLAVGVGSLQDGVAGVIDQHVPGPEHLGVLEWLERNL